MSGAAALAVLAVLELDASLVAQTMISRPLVAATLVGAASGAALIGVIFGAVFELLGLCSLPVGGCLTWSATVAAGTATVLAGQGVSAPLCVLGGLAAGGLHSRLEGFERTRRAATGDALALRAELGGGALGRSLGLSIALHGVMTFALTLAVVLAVKVLDRAVWPGVPPAVDGGARIALLCAPWIGLSGAVVRGLRRA